MKSKTHFARLYITEIPDKPLETVYSKERQIYIDSTANQRLKRQRYFVWKLLEFALNDTLGLNQQETLFYVDEYGKWSCDKCFFSLSHSKNAIAVAISNMPIGLDIENSQHRLHKQLHKKILTEQEMADYSAIPLNEKNSFLLQKWCAKESLFKMCGEKQFKPQTIETNSNIKLGTEFISNQKYFYSVASEISEYLTIHKNIII